MHLLAVSCRISCEGRIFTAFSLGICDEKITPIHCAITNDQIVEFQFRFHKYEEHSLVNDQLKFENIWTISWRVRLLRPHYGVQALLTSMIAIRRNRYFLLNRYIIRRQILQCYVHVSIAVHGLSYQIVLCTVWWVAQVI